MSDHVRVRVPSGMTLIVEWGIADNHAPFLPYVYREEMIDEDTIPRLEHQLEEALSNGRKPKSKSS